MKGRHPVEAPPAERARAGRGEPKPLGIVLGMNPNALGTVRSLDAAGIDVVAVDFPPAGPHDIALWMSSRTRACRRLFLDPEMEGEAGLMKGLHQLGDELREPGVLIPSSDAQVMVLARNRKALSRSFRFVLPGDETLELLLDKRAFAGHVLATGMPAPRTWLLDDVGSWEPPGDSILFPSVIKADCRGPDWFSVFGDAKAVVAHDRRELEATLGKVSGFGMTHRILVQEVIPGEDDQLFFSHVYLRTDGEVAGLWTGRKLRQHPKGFGTSTLCETVDVPEVREQTLALLQPLGFAGYASVEFKRDARDGRYKVIEVTPARTWYPHFLGTVAGMNLPEIWFWDALGERRQARGPVRPGVRWVDEYRDFHAAIELIRDGSLTVPQWLRSYRGLRGFALASAFDPVPTAFMGLRLGLGAARTLRHRLVGRPQA